MTNEETDETIFRLEAEIRRQREVIETWHTEYEKLKKERDMWETNAQTARAQFHASMESDL